MCDLKKGSKLETVTVYKVCYKHEYNYYAVFSGLKIGTGLVKYMGFIKKIDGLRFRTSKGYREGQALYNPLAVGRTTGFKSKKIAEGMRQLFLGRDDDDANVVVLKMEISDDLVIGTGQKIMSSYEKLNTSIVYAGKNVVSFEEIDTNSCLSKTEKNYVSMCNDERKKKRAEIFAMARENRRKLREKRVKERNELRNDIKVIPV